MRIPTKSIQQQMTVQLEDQWKVDKDIDPARREVMKQANNEKERRLTSWKPKDGTIEVFRVVAENLWWLLQKDM